MPTLQSASQRQINKHVHYTREGLEALRFELMILMDNSIKPLETIFHDDWLALIKSTQNELLFRVVDLPEYLEEVMPSNERYDVVAFFREGVFVKRGKKALVVRHYGFSDFSCKEVDKEWELWKAFVK